MDSQGEWSGAWRIKVIQSRLKLHLCPQPWENSVFVSISLVLRKALPAFLKQMFLWLTTPSPLIQGRADLYLGQGLRWSRHPVIME